MTMTIKIEHVSGPQYQARVKQEGRPDVVLKPSESAQFGIHSGTFLTVLEEPLEKSSQGSLPSEGQDNVGTLNSEAGGPDTANATSGTLAEHVEKLQDAAAQTDNPGEQITG